MKPISKLGIGPMSQEIIEAVYRYSENNSEPLMLIASKNQIDWSGGYVNDWTTRQFAEYCNVLKKKYPKAKVYLCRDHCGPGFKNDDINDVYKTINDDLDNGFEVIHIDFCHYKGVYEERLAESKKAIEHILKKKPGTIIEIGTDENKGDFLTNIKHVDSEMEFFKKVAPIHFFVCQTGSLIKEVNQAGAFNTEFLKKIKDLSVKYDFCLKEHNADYLDSRSVAMRKGIIDAVNVAPQYGIIQTTLTLSKCYAYGINVDDYLEDAYMSGKWKKWLKKNDQNNKYLCSVIAGHYNFAKDSYKKIYKEINKYEDFRETIIKEIMNNIDIYIKNF
ncbi:MAG: hypothetical protein CO137_01445 [Candidatus Magasanikbacteria bacterium CG_4_9_14_3_um_filter_32_9]|uniref:Tagatose-6-phosphate kinase n=1 Tax=Candidatus Magasanikbacteria bacterium CG_4_9_14_3_um_filter_32_9 TaxID=1974644 RepID=A0A2M7Z733_9BACT|nr:MAG: hypothetical protein CO137_01445 [Candidatus Magasanikbacteria bacterium CG_4_9_14_3_um_filter_32_9]